MSMERRFILIFPGKWRVVVKNLRSLEIAPVEKEKRVAPTVKSQGQESGKDDTLLKVHLTRIRVRKCRGEVA